MFADVDIGCFLWFNPRIGVRVKNVKFFPHRRLYSMLMAVAYFFRTSVVWQILTQVGRLLSYPDEAHVSACNGSSLVIYHFQKHTSSQNSTCVQIFSSQVPMLKQGHSRPSANSWSRTRNVVREDSWKIENCSNFRFLLIVIYAKGGYHEVPRSRYVCGRYPGGHMFFCPGWRHTQSITADAHFVAPPSSSSLLLGCILSGVENRLGFLHIEKFSSLAEVPYPPTYKRFLRTLDVFNFGERDTGRSTYMLHYSSSARQIERRRLSLFTG